MRTFTNNKVEVHKDLTVTLSRRLFIRNAHQRSDWKSQKQSGEEKGSCMACNDQLQWDGRMKAREDTSAIANFPCETKY